MNKTLGVVLSMAVVVAAAAASAARPTPADLPERIQSILQRSCAVSGCHLGRFPAKKLNLAPEAFPGNAVGVASRQVPGFKLVDPAAPDKSYLLMKVSEGAEIAGKRMPIGRRPLDPEEIQVLREWIDGLDR